jgi:hypothetical protein
MLPVIIRGKKRANKKCIVMNLYHRMVLSRYINTQIISVVRKKA